MAEATLLDRVAGTLERGRVPFALIGAAALAVHGISRSTLDIDVLVSEPRVLDGSFWKVPAEVALDIRPGDAADPLAGVVRFTAPGERDVDIVVGRGAWVANILSRAEPVRHHGRDVPVASPADLVLLKLYAGGSQDRWDIEQLLARPDRDAIIDAVERSLPQLPARARHVWETLRSFP